MTEDLINKYFDDSYTEEELKDLVQWIITNAEDKHAQDLVFEIWNNYKADENQIDDEKFGVLFDKIQQKIDADTNIQPGHRKIPFSIFTMWLIRAAAVLLIPVLGLLFYTISERKTDYNRMATMAVDSLEIIAPIGSRTVVHLSDGSKVHLNYGSTLKYPQVFSGETRGVVLTGEGYFDVAHNPDKPFIVETGRLNIKAVGTEFNVQSYPDDNDVSTTLVEGKVILEKQLSGEKTELIGAMKPGQHVNYNFETGEVSSEVGDVGKYIAWKDGKMIFEDTPIVEVANQLSRMFNVEIEVDDDIKDYYYTVTFIDEPLFQILDLMTIATPVAYKALPRKKLPDGTFTIQKIKIERKLKPD